MSIVTTRPILETYDHNGVQSRHTRAYGLRRSSFYGEQGGGFGILTWNEDRAIGPDYPDIGFLHEVILRKGLCLELFKGVVLNISEATGNRDTITVTAAGRGSLFEFVPLNRVYQDARTTKWTAPSEVSGSFVPNKFSTLNRDGALVLQPRRGTRYRAGEYAYVRYSMPFDQGIERIAFSSHVELPNDWPGRFEVCDQSSVLWSSCETSRGQVTLKPVAGATYLETRFTVRDWGENTAQDGTVYGRLANVRVISEPVSPIRIGDVARDVLSEMEDYGVDQDTSRIDNLTVLPATVAFEDDRTAAGILTWCAQYGGPTGELLAWGVDEENRLYVEKQDLDTVQWYVRRQSGLQMSVQGSVEGSAQRVYVVYTDSQNVTRRTEDAVDQEMIDELGGMARRIAYRVSGIADEASAETLGALRVAEEARPRTSSSISVSDRVYSPTGKAKAVDEIGAGGLVAITDFRAREATLGGGDFRDQWSTHQLVGVEIDGSGRTVRLIPAGAQNTFERRLAMMLREQQEGV